VKINFINSQLEKIRSKYSSFDGREFDVTMGMSGDLRFMQW